jgi:glucose-6-phosphate isomerase
MISINTNLLSPFLKKSDYHKIANRVRRAQQDLLNRNCRGKKMLGWLDLPVRQSSEELNAILAPAEHLRHKAPCLVIVGIGGSYLGSRSALEFLQPQWRRQPDQPEILFFGHHLGSTYASELLHYLDDRDYCVCVISKSGSTTETGVAFRLLRQHMEKKYTTDEIRERVLTITEAEKGSLRRVTMGEGYQNLLHPDDVGGRFSVLSTVGLLPMAAAGIDIRRLLQGAAEMRTHCMQETDIMKNDALKYAASRYLLYKKGKTIENLAVFESSLQYVSEWWKQLYGESEGKEHKGLFPAATMMTTDLHSMGQYLQEGKRSLFETFLVLADNPSSPVVANWSKNLDGLNYLAGVELGHINKKAYEGTALAHDKGGVPNLTITLANRTPECLGALYYMFEFAVSVSGLLLDVNPFNQPGVEAYKKNMFALLGKPGYEKDQARVEKRLKKLNG